MTLFLGGVGHGFPLAEAVDMVLNASPGKKFLKVGTPYLSGAGLEALLGPLSSSDAWKNAPKSWLVGIHHGITEPAALRTLIDLPNSTSRLFTVNGSLSFSELRARPMFHAKVVAVEAQSVRRGQLAGIVTSSANLTSAALGHTGVNYEAGAAISISDAATKIRWAAWWQAAWHQGISLSLQAADRYERLRDRFVTEHDIALDLVDPPSNQLLSSAPSLWIEAGAMSGGSRNQVEFNRELAGFFGAVAKSTKILTIRSGKKLWNDRPLTPKTTTFGVEIWRLSLPTESSGGWSYPGKAIRLSRDPSQPEVFLLDVTPAGSRLSQQWRTEACRSGYVGRTSGNREFGLS
jgi:hypothetical protein